MASPSTMPPPPLPLPRSMDMPTASTSTQPRSPHDTPSPLTPPPVTMLPRSRARRESQSKHPTPIGSGRSTPAHLGAASGRSTPFERLSEEGHKRASQQDTSAVIEEGDASDSPAARVERRRSSTHGTSGNLGISSSEPNTEGVSAPVSTSFSGSTATSTTSIHPSLITPSSPSGTSDGTPSMKGLTGVQPLPKVHKQGSGSSQTNTTANSTTSLTGLVSLTSVHPNQATSARAESLNVAPVNGDKVHQTGASKMAAAAKRGNAGIDGLPGGAVSGDEGEDHPLSDKCLKARDYQTITTLNRLFHLPSRWKLKRPLGQGAYGLVISVQDSLSGEPVAVKCITRVFDKVILARRALREITLLRHFGGHENLTGLIDLDNVWDGYNEIYLYMEPMEADLHQIIRSEQGLSNSHIQYFLYQLLRGMKYIHSADVIHRDLKPGNLLVNADCELKICDFGLARGFIPVTGEADQNEALKLTEYVATRWYRAPEVMLSNRRYTTAIDVWSIGCILAELIAGKPIFKGKDYVDQLNLILGVLGTPSDEVLGRVAAEKAAAYVQKLPRSEPVPLQLVLPEADPQALDLLSHLLDFDSYARINVVDALTHPYVAPYHDPMDEPSCSEPFTKWEQVESLETIQELREAISREIEEYRAEVRSLPTPDFSDMGEDEERSPEERHKAVLGESSGSVFNSPSVDQAGPASAAPSSADWEEGPGGLSSKIRRDSLSPENVKHALHHNDLGVSPTTKSSIPLPRSRSHSRHRDGLPVDKRERGSTPPTPATALSPVSESGPSSVPISGGGMSGRTSRRSSGYSGYGSSVPRRPNSFLFGGGGMTPMTSMAKAASSHNVNTNQSGYQDTFLPSATSTPSAVVHEVGEPSWVRSRSRAPSMAGQPLLIRQLSMVGLQDLGGDGVGSGAGEGDGHGLGRSGQEETIGLGLEIPPMRVSPSDAPASELPSELKE